MCIKKEKPSHKIIILRQGKEDRILCAEISEHAHRPGVGISAQTLAEANMLELLNLIKTFNLVDFTGFSDAENQKFKNEFVRTVRKLSLDLGPGQP